MWTPDVPKFETKLAMIGPYHGPSGWHFTRQRKPGERKPGIREAIEICRDHHWIGYIEWESNSGIETDSCKFLRRVDQP